MNYTTFLPLLATLLAEFHPEQFDPSLKPRDSAECLPCRNITFDFIIVGAGTAGCVLANRLSAYPHFKVLLIEAGSDEDYVTDTPGLREQILFSSYTWRYFTVKQKRNCLGSGGGFCIFPGGYSMGGTSAIGGMTFARGNPRDFDEWEAMGNSGWSYKDVLPYFKKLENVTIPELASSFDRSIYGPQTVGYTKFNLSIFPDLLGAGIDYGLDVVDYNGRKQEGVGYTQFTVRGPNRCSTAKAYLNPIRERPNLFIFKNTLVTKVLFSEGTPKRAIGVRCRTAGEEYDVYSSKEVILSAGVVNTPQLLMLSGVGAKYHLGELGIPVIADLPVGNNLIDHNEIFMFFKLNTKLLDHCEPYTEETIMEYVTHGTGALTSTPSQVIAFIKQPTKGSSCKKSVETELIFGMDCGTFEGTEEKRIKVLVGNRNPKSRGTIRLTSSDPTDMPLIDPNYYANPVDMNSMVIAMKQTLKYMNQSSLKKYTPIWNIVETPQCDSLCNYSNNEITDDFLECYIKYNGNPGLHPVGTARMGNKYDRKTVVSQELKVHHLESLRVVDASVMPRITRSPTAGPVIMIAEKASDIILCEHLAEGALECR